MAPETQEQSSTAETAGQEQQEGQQQQAAPESGGSDQQQQAPKPVVIDKSTQLPDDHPLVTAHSTVKGKLAEANTALAEARAQAANATKLEEELNKRPTPEALETLQKRYDRLEAFTQSVGLGKALDSRTFTRDLFETDKDIATLVKEYNRANPSPTTTALGGGAGQDGGAKANPNDLLRAAMHGSN